MKEKETSTIEFVLSVKIQTKWNRFFFFSSENLIFKKMTNESNVVVNSPSCNNGLKWINNAKSTVKKKTV